MHRRVSWTGLVVRKGDVAVARNVGVPAIALADDVVHGGADRLFRIVVGRHRVGLGLKLVGGMVAHHAQVVGAGLDDARDEFVEPVEHG